MASDAATDTIFALSSGRPPAAIAVVRMSGPKSRMALEALIGRVPEPRKAALARVRDPATQEVIDEALVLWFPAPRSETGEDVAELQLHGGRAVIAAVLAALSRIDGLRPAEAGEFTRRAFLTGHLDLTAVVAPSLAAAAQYYPAAYWYSMVKIPDKSLFPGTGDKGNGIPEMFKTQEQWLNFIKTNGCGNCHQLGNYATRMIAAALGKFETSSDAWAYRLSVGPSGHDMVRFITQLMTPDGGQLARLADWTDRIEAGELPSRSPQRPTGIERSDQRQ